MQWKFLGRVIYLSKTAGMCLGAVLFALLTVGGYLLLAGQETDTVFEQAGEMSGAETQDKLPEKTEPLLPTQTPGSWQVYVVGAVAQPGLYALKEGALVYDAVMAAGGLLPEAEADKVNMAQELEANLMIRILTPKERLAQERESSLVMIKNNVEIYGEQVGSGNSSSAIEPQKGKININTATKEELMTLPGIGEVKADSILAYREEHGPFQTIEDLMQVSGIKENGFAKIKDSITT